MPSVGQIVAFLGERALAVKGDTSVQVRGFAAAAPGEAEHISFVKGRVKNALQILDASNSIVFLAPVGTSNAVTSAKVVVEVASPRLEFARIANEFFPVHGGSDTTGVHASALVGEGSVIGSGAVVEADVVIGRDCVIGPNVVIKSRCVIGDRVKVGPGSVIGEVGFGFERDEDGRLIRLPHYGRVRLGDDVEIGANVVVDRGVFADTTIKSGVKVDSLALIGHNVVIEENALVIGGALLGGSVRVGARAWIAPNATIMQKLTIGEDSTVGIGAVVLRDVPAGVTVFGNYARPLPRMGS